MEEGGGSKLTFSHPRAKHLCVLVHGLYGNPSHLDYLASALREKHGQSLYILVAKRNTGVLTYDGIELGGERVAHEIEETLEDLSDQGYVITKLSIAGYSLGGLVARYAIGLLHAKGYFDNIEPINFTTFVTPHVGVRCPRKRGHFWNVLGARTVSTSGRQLFMIDSFRDTGRPLLSVLATPGSIFMVALSKFKHRCLYANIVNDRAAVFYTTGISVIDPFTQLDKVNINYVRGYAPVVVDPDMFFLPTDKEVLSFSQWISNRGLPMLSGLLFCIFMFIAVPITCVLFLINSGIQTVRSRKRIRLHGEGKLGVLFDGYKVPLIIEEMRHAVEDIYDVVNAAQSSRYLGDVTGEDSDREMPHIFPKERFAPSARGKVINGCIPSEENFRAASNNGGYQSSSISSPRNIPHRLELRTLALTPAQFEIIDNLNAVGFRKYPVYIHKARHSHAAIIVRRPKKRFEEGKVVVRHWLEGEFRP